VIFLPLDSAGPGPGIRFLRNSDPTTIFKNTSILCQLTEILLFIWSKKLNNFKFCEMYDYKKGETANILLANFFPTSFLLLLDPASEMEKRGIRDLR
jgi:hypothetical protein